VIKAAPEVMLASWCGKPFEPETVRAREGWDAIPALQTGRMHEIRSADILQPGPACLTTGLDTIEALLA
jgi:iron complex transport system substrate-binding protein